MKVAVEQGQVTVNSVYVLIDDPRVKVLEVDCRTKNGEVLATCGGSRPDTLGVVLGSGEHTLRAAKTDRPTEISVADLPPGIWDIEATGGRYSFRLFLYRLDIGAEPSPEVLYLRPKDMVPEGWRINNPDWPSGDGEYLVPDDGA